MTDSQSGDGSSNGVTNGTPLETVGFELLDQASSNVPLMSPEVQVQAKVSADHAEDLDARLEAFEDIIDSEVGDTSFSRARNLERRSGLRQIYLKFEGGNPTGTQKDRIAFAQAMDAMRRGFDAVTVATCGNYGVAMSLATSLAGLRCIVYLPENYHTRRVQEMVSFGAELVRIPGDYEAAVNASSERAAKDEIYDANPGGDNTALQLRAYGQIAHEIYDELRDAPAMVAISVSNGTTLAGLHKGFLSLFRRGKTSRMPKLVAGSSFRKNPIVHAFQKGLEVCPDLKPSRIRETAVNEPLINWHSIDGDLGLDAVRSTGGFAADATDKNMLLYARLLREHEGLSVLPASTAGLVALMEYHAKHTLPGDRYVAVLTGRKS
jgi:threonine synthase